MRSHRTLERDLLRWEAGELGLAELEARSPSAGVHELVGMHELVAATAAEPVPDPDASWEALRSRLPDRVPKTVGGRRRTPARRLLVAVAATLLIGGIAYAAAPEAVSERLGELWDRIRSVFVAEPPASPGPTGDVPPATKSGNPTGFPAGLGFPADDDADEGDDDEPGTDVTDPDGDDEADDAEADDAEADDDEADDAEADDAEADDDEADDDEADDDEADDPEADGDDPRDPEQNFAEPDEPDDD